MKTAPQTLLTGIKPTGTPHVGNLVGAIWPMLGMARDYERSYMFIADLHALNAVRDPAEIRQNTYELAATFLALGLNPDKTILFRQSDISEVYHLNTLLMNVTPKGLMNRAHAYKAAMDRNVEKGEDPDVGINMGLYTYPLLMAADILLYGADTVPVGQDQKQHVEFARDIAGAFNALYGKDLLVTPQPVIPEEAGVIPGLDGRKMSKSYDNTIPIFLESGPLKKAVMKVVTDSKLPEEPKDPGTSTIIQLYRHFAPAGNVAVLEDRFRAGGIGYGEAKTALFEAMDAALSGPREMYKALMADTGALDALLDKGAAEARRAAEKTLTRVKRAMLGR